MMTSVVVCDDHGIIRSGIQKILEATEDMRLVGSTHSGHLLLEMVEEVRPDLVVLDIRLGDCSGLDLLERIEMASPCTRVVMLSMYGAKGYVEKAKARGARGYITKECLDEDLLSVLYAAKNGESFVSLCSGATNPGAATGRADARIDLLSTRELDVAKLIASGLTNTEIAEDLTVSPRTVESHRANIHRKLQLRTRAELARVARDAGLLD